MTNSTVPTKFKKEKKLETIIGRHSIIGAGSIYAGSPAKKIKNRKKSLLKLEKQYLLDIENDSI